jgi:hypothetical protein
MLREFNLVGCSYIDIIDSMEEKLNRPKGVAVAAEQTSSYLFPS